jgi:hypothetical protein
MTIAPTIYAGFIARGYQNMGELFTTDFQDILRDNVEQANLPQEALDELAQIGRQMASAGGSVDQAHIQDVVDSIQSPALKEVIDASVAEVTRLAAENGYGGLYWSAAVISALIIVGAFVLAPLRRKIAASAPSEG